MMSRNLITLAIAAAALTNVEGKRPGPCRIITKTTNSVTTSTLIGSSSSSQESIIYTSTSTAASSYTEATSFVTLTTTETPSAEGILSSTDASDTTVAVSETISPDVSSSIISDPNTSSSELPLTTDSTTSSIPTTVTTAEPIPTVRNFASNPGFEDGILFPWQINIGLGYQSIEPSTAEISAKEGSHYFRARITQDNDARDTTLLMSQTVEGLDTAKSYKFSFWSALGDNRFENDGANNVNIVGTLDMRIGPAMIYDNPTLYPIGTWQYSEQVITPPSSTVSLSITINDYTLVPVDVLIDRISLVEITA